MSARILLVEDEPGLVITLRDRLTSAGFRVSTAGAGAAALETLDEEEVDLVVLDLMLPDMDGFEVCRRIRERDPQLPVLMLTARGAVQDRVKGLEIGADDYLVKPFDAAELIARIEALLRRSGTPPRPTKRYRFGVVEVDFQRAECTVAGEPVGLSARLMKLLEFFISRPGEVVSREELLNDVWGYEAMPSTRTVDVHVSWLRRAIETDASDPKHIVTVHGRGYKFVPDP